MCLHVFNILSSVCLISLCFMTLVFLFLYMSPSSLNMPRLYKYPAGTIKHRFSTIRWHKAVSDLSDNQKSFVRKYELDNLLNIHPHLMVPIPILQWVVDHLNCNGTGVFRKGDKIIHLRRYMVIQIFGIRSGFVPFPLDNTDPVVVARVLQFRS